MARHTPRRSSWSSSLRRSGSSTPADVDNPLLLPALHRDARGVLGRARSRAAAWRARSTSLQVLVMGYACGLLLAAVLTTLAVSTRIGTDFLSTLTAMFNPLPAIALLPLALLVVRTGRRSLVFVIVHSVLWAVALNTHSGFTVGRVRRCAWRARITDCAGLSLCDADPDAGGVSVDHDRPENRLGVCLAHADRGRTGVRRPARAPADSAGSSSRTATSSRRRGVRGPAHGDPDRPVRRERHLPHARERTVRRWGMQS